MTLLTFASILCLTTTAVFVLLYGTHRWFATHTGWSIMALAVGVSGLAVGGLVYSHLHTEIGMDLLTVAYLVVSAVMGWRTWLMWSVNRPKEK